LDGLKGFCPRTRSPVLYSSLCTFEPLYLQAFSKFSSVVHDAGLPLALPWCRRSPCFNVDICRGFSGWPCCCRPAPLLNPGTNPIGGPVTTRATHGVSVWVPTIYVEDHRST